MFKIIHVLLLDVTCTTTQYLVIVPVYILVSHAIVAVYIQVSSGIGNFMLYKDGNTAHSIRMATIKDVILGNFIQRGKEIHLS